MCLHSCVRKMRGRRFGHGRVPVRQPESAAPNGRRRAPWGVAVAVPDPRSASCRSGFTGHDDRSCQYPLRVLGCSCPTAQDHPIRINRYCAVCEVHLVPLPRRRGACATVTFVSTRCWGGAPRHPSDVPRNAPDRNGVGEQLRVRVRREIGPLPSHTVPRSSPRLPSGVPSDAGRSRCMTPASAARCGNAWSPGERRRHSHLSSGTRSARTVPSVPRSPAGKAHSSTWCWKVSRGEWPVRESDQFSCGGVQAWCRRIMRVARREGVSRIAVLRRATASGWESC